MKLQINSKEALERLIGEDKEVEISIKAAIVNQFAKQYLKSVANSAVMDEIKRAVIREVKEETKDYIGKTNWGNDYFVKDENLKNAIRKCVKEELDNLIREAVKEQFTPLEQEVKFRLGVATDLKGLLTD
ncbi:MAG: hypothetical protein HDS71_09345 [Bacteroidales bacterium]|nr:hypothetical protein [Bacteroidales bacterium]